MRCMCVAMVFAVCEAFAQEDGIQNDEGYYAGVVGGGNFFANPKVRLSLGDHDEQYDPGYLGSFFLGYRFDSAWRMEGELGYRRNTLDEIENKATGAKVGGEGEVDAWHFLLSLYYDIDMGFAVKPYVGAGLGYSRMTYENKSVGYIHVNDNDERVAYQFVLGASYDLARKYTLFVDYRYFGTRNPKFSDTAANSLESEFVNHTANLGVRLKF